MALFHLEKDQRKLERVLICGIFVPAGTVDSPDLVEVILTELKEELGIDCFSGKYSVVIKFECSYIDLTPFFQNTVDTGQYAYYG